MRATEVCDRLLRRARNGTELFYLYSAGAMTRVPVQTAPVFSAGTATTLFKTRYAVPGVAARTYASPPMASGS